MKKIKYKLEEIIQQNQLIHMNEDTDYRIEVNEKDSSVYFFKF